MIKTACLFLAVCFVALLLTTLVVGGARVVEHIRAEGEDAPPNVTAPAWVDPVPQWQTKEDEAASEVDTRRSRRPGRVQAIAAALNARIGLLAVKPELPDSAGFPFQIQSLQVQSRQDFAAKLGAPAAHWMKDKDGNLFNSDRRVTWDTTNVRVVLGALAADNKSVSFDDKKVASIRDSIGSLFARDCDWVLAQSTGIREFIVVIMEETAADLESDRSTDGQTYVIVVQSKNGEYRSRALRRC